jgi:hypothetical protein
LEEGQQAIPTAACAAAAAVAAAILVAAAAAAVLLGAWALAAQQCLPSGRFGASKQLSSHGVGQSTNLGGRMLQQGLQAGCCQQRHLASLLPWLPEQLLRHVGNKFSQVPRGSFAAASRLPRAPLLLIVTVGNAAGRGTRLHEHCVSSLQLFRAARSHQLAAASQHVMQRKHAWVELRGPGQLSRVSVSLRLAGMELERERKGQAVMLGVQQRHYSAPACTVHGWER